MPLFPASFATDNPSFVTEDSREGVNKAGVAINKLSKGVLGVESIRLVLTLLDLSFNICRPIVGLLLAFEVIANGRVAFDADDCPPNACSVFISTLRDRSHCSNLWFFWFERLDDVGKIILRCTAIAQRRQILA